MAASSAIYTSFLSGDGPLVSNTGIWRVDVTTGEATVLVPGVTDGKHLLVRAIATASDGTLNALVHSVDTIPAYGDAGLTYQWAHVDAINNSLTIVRPEAYAYADQVLWSPGDRGVIVQKTNDAGLSTLTWMSQDNTAPTVLARIEDLGDVEWGGRKM